MASEAEICSNALRQLGANPIVALTEDSPEGRLCQSLYPATRDELIGMHWWHFSLARIALATLSDTPAFDYTVRYSLPADFIRAKEIFPKHTEYRIEGREVLAYNTALKMVYSRRVTDTSLFPPYFTAALEYFMASKLAFPIARQRSLEESKYQRFLIHFDKAQTLNDQEDTPDQILSNDLIDVRVQSA